MSPKPVHTTYRLVFPNHGKVRVERNGQLVQYLHVDVANRFATEKADLPGVRVEVIRKGALRVVGSKGGSR